MAYKLPTQSPFVNNVGINFSVQFTKWYLDLLKTPDAAKRYPYTKDRLNVIVKKFKLVKVYSLLTAGWESTLNVTPEAQALLDLLPYNNIEAVFGTTLSKDWFMVQDNVNKWVDVVYNKLGTRTNKIKAILIGNEINANGYTAIHVKTIMNNFASAQARYGLTIPVTVDFSNLPNQAGDSYSDSLVKAVVDNWNINWNKGFPFVFINPYPDAAGINNAEGVYNWQNGVANYYQKKYSALQIFIGETGAEGCSTEATAITCVNSIFTQLENQYLASNKTVPTFMFEAVNESEKPLIPNQQHMGLYLDKPAANGNDITIKNGIRVPNFI